MSLGTILIIILIIFLLGGFSGRFGGYGYGDPASDGHDLRLRELAARNTTLPGVSVFGSSYDAL